MVMIPDDTALRKGEFEVSMENLLHPFKALSVRSCYNDVISRNCNDCFICLVYPTIDGMIYHKSTPATGAVIKPHLKDVTSQAKILDYEHEKPSTNQGKPIELMHAHGSNCAAFNKLEQISLYLYGA
eukprot:7440558-Ditylum_brightwellii.AAC.2